MQVAQLRRFFNSVGTLLAESGGKKLSDDVESVNTALLAFDDLNVSELAEFLRQSAEYRRTGILPEPKIKGRKQAKAASLDAAKVASFAQSLSGLKERAVDDSITISQIQDAVAKANKALNKDELIAVARELDIPGAIKTKSDARNLIEELIRRRKHTSEIATHQPQDF